MTNAIYFLYSQNLTDALNFGMFFSSLKTLLYLSTICRLFSCLVMFLCSIHRKSVQQRRVPHTKKRRQSDRAPHPFMCTCQLRPNFIRFEIFYNCSNPGSPAAIPLFLHFTYSTVNRLRKPNNKNKK